MLEEWDFELECYDVVFVWVREWEEVRWVEVSEFKIEVVKLR